MTNYPNKIEIIVDGNTLQFEGLDKKGTILNYRYTKSETKFGLILPMPPEQLEKMIKNNIAKII